MSDEVRDYYARIQPVGGGYVNAFNQTHGGGGAPRINLPDISGLFKKKSYDQTVLNTTEGILSDKDQVAAMFAEARLNDNVQYPQSSTLSESVKQEKTTQEEHFEEIIIENVFDEILEEYDIDIRSMKMQGATGVEDYNRYERHIRSVWRQQLAAEIQANNTHVIETGINAAINVDNLVYERSTASDGGDSGEGITEYDDGAFHAGLIRLADKHTESLFGLNEGQIADVKRNIISAGLVMQLHRQSNSGDDHVLKGLQSTFDEVATAYQRGNDYVATSDVARTALIQYGAKWGLSQEEINLAISTHLEPAIEAEKNFIRAGLENLHALAQSGDTTAAEAYMTILRQNFVNSGNVLVMNDMRYWHSISPGIAGGSGQEDINVANILDPYEFVQYGHAGLVAATTILKEHIGPALNLDDAQVNDLVFDFVEEYNKYYKSETIAKNPELVNILKSAQNQIIENNKLSRNNSLPKEEWENIFSQAIANALATNPELIDDVFTANRDNNEAIEKGILTMLQDQLDDNSSVISQNIYNLADRYVVTGKLIHESLPNGTWLIQGLVSEELREEYEQLIGAKIISNDVRTLQVEGDRLDILQTNSNQLLGKNGVFNGIKNNLKNLLNKLGRGNEYNNIRDAFFSGGAKMRVTLLVVTDENGSTEIGMVPNRSLPSEANNLEGVEKETLQSIRRDAHYISLPNDLSREDRNDVVNENMLSVAKALIRYYDDQEGETNPSGTVAPSSSNTNAEYGGYNPFTGTANPIER